jgi:Flp pilus assembly pilin Flp
MGGFILKSFLQELWKEEDGLQTVELVLILLVLVGLIAVLQTQLSAWLNGAIEKTQLLIDGLG